MKDHLPGIRGIRRSTGRPLSHGRRDPCYSLREIAQMVGCSEKWIRDRLDKIPPPDVIGTHTGNEMRLWKQSTVNRVLLSLKEEYANRVS